jgi:hypothetical protein
MSYLKTLFPDALFIHVMRDPRAVVASLLKVHFWNDLEAWWRDGATLASLIREGERPEELAAMYWVQETEAAIQSEAEMADSVMHVNYEKITESLSSELRRVFDFTRLEWTRSQAAWPSVASEQGPPFPIGFNLPMTPFRPPVGFGIRSCETSKL